MLHFLHHARGVLERLNYTLVLVASGLIVAINLFTLWEVFTRYALQRPAAWSVPLTGYLLLYVIFAATAYTLQRGGHVQVDFALGLMPPRLRRQVERWAHILGLGFIGILMWQALRLTLRVIDSAERDITTLAWPLSYTTSAMPLGLGLMGITYLFVVLDAFLPPPERAEPPGPPGSNSS